MIKTAPISLALTLLLAVLIAYGTLKPPGPPQEPGLLTDKQVHFIAFALLVLPLAWVLPRGVIWLVALAILYGGAIELIQPFVGRSAEWADLLADTGGVIAGVLPGLIRQKVRG